MNNINIKSKKTTVLNMHRFLPITSKYDSYYAAIYCILAKKRSKTLVKNEFKYKLASLYDATFNVDKTIEKNIINIRYTLVAIKDEFLPIDISGEAKALFTDGIEIYSFDDEEITQAYNEMNLYFKNFLDNKQNVALIKLNDAINIDNNLTLREIEAFYKNPNLEQTQKWIKTLKTAEKQTLNFNNGAEKLEQQFSKLTPKLNTYVQAKPIICDENLDQAYINIGFKLNSSKPVANNIANMILGGDVYSKLFKIIREKNSLSYNVRSSFLADNLITVSGGVNVSKVEFCLDEIDKIVDDVINGNFENELELAKINYLQLIKKNKSNEMSYIKMYSNNYLMHTKKTHESLSDEVKKVTKEEVQLVFAKMEKLTTVIIK